MQKKQKRVLIVLGRYDYRLHKGIERYALEHGWRLSADSSREKVLPWRWNGHGILAWLGMGNHLVKFVKHYKKRVVDFSFHHHKLNFPRVLGDNTRAAELVAEHFLTRGLNHFVFYSEADRWFYEERGEAFVQALKRAGHSCVWLRWHKSPVYRANREQWDRRQEWLATKLKQSPKPLALFCANDDHAMHALEACESVNLVVPEEVAIVGAGNYLMAPDATPTPISSVDTNLEMVGYRGAKLLDDLMNGEKPPQAPIRIPPVGLVIRKSSDLLAVNHKGVASSLRFIWEHCHEPIGVENLTDVAAMSRRGLHKAFIEHLGRSPGQELHRIRIERAKRLLSESKHKIELLASMCGYQSANSFYIAFKQSTGASPKQYRDTMGSNGRHHSKTNW
ncbi:MAG TPA: DNA-binding transcriptional regulator [Candidatus Aquilonibacter sp.]|nr:DNA-binding transcriptional regulator [Candidatus Aquilonibacter sp.]